MTQLHTRRGFLATSAVAALALHAERAAAQSASRGASRGVSRWPRFAPLLSGADAAPELKTLGAAALDAAKRAGASYADVRFRVSQNEEWSLFQGPPPRAPQQYFIMGVGVRALLNGYWGIAAHDALPSVDAMAMLGREAAAQAAITAKGPARQVDLAPTPVVSDGQWTMPVGVDPFTVSYDEKLDFVMGVLEDIRMQAYGMNTLALIGFLKEARTFASSDGSFLSQTVYATRGVLRVGVDPDWETEQGGSRSADFLTSAGAGWEYIRNMPYRDGLAGMVEDAQRMRRSKPVQIGRYDLVLDAAAMAGVLDQTITKATELDRAMGYLANDEGSSFLDDPLAMLGSYQIGSPLVTITANRSLAGGGATVKWDEEGVEPSEITLVNNGILADFQTTRESAGWLSSRYQSLGRPVRSSGGASANEATVMPRARNANFALAPDATHDTTFDDLVARAKSGYAIKGGAAYSDFQGLNGTITGDVVYEIVNGKLGQVVTGAQVALRAPEFWKNVAALGGARSRMAIGSRPAPESGNRRENAPGLRNCYTIQAVPALVTQQPMTDSTRKG